MWRHLRVAVLPLITVVGDTEKIRPVMEKYGPAEVYDTEGKPITTASN